MEKKKQPQSTGYVMKYIQSTHVTLNALEIISFCNYWTNNLFIDRL